MKPSSRYATPALGPWIVLGLLMGLTTALPARADTLKNDGWTSGTPVGFQSGFVAGEEGAVTLGPVSQGMLMHTVQFLFGGNASAASVTIRIYEEVGTADPGTMLHQETLFLTGSDTILQELDLFASQVFIPTGGSVRVSFRFVHAGLPSIARDSDGTIQTGRNWISTPGLGWVDSQLWGLTGDFIVRALVLPATGPGPDAGVDGGIPADGGGMGDGGPDPDAGADLDGGADPDGGVDPDGGANPDGGTDPDAGGVPTQCDDSSACEGGYICYRGSCLLMCLSTDECPDGSVCHQGFCAATCDDSTECAGGEACQNSICVAYCTADEECLAGEECSNFRCRLAVQPVKGCGCTMTPDLRTLALPALLLLALLLLLARRLRAAD